MNNANIIFNNIGMHDLPDYFNLDIPLYSAACGGMASGTAMQLDAYCRVLCIEMHDDCCRMQAIRFDP